MKFLSDLLWTYPAAIMTAWTLLTLAVAWTAPLNRPIPGIIGVHPMMMQLNPKDEILYSRPSLWMALAYLVVGAIPLVCALLLVFLVWAIGAVQYERAAKYLRKRFGRQSAA
jgi:hypothetical protein